MSQKIITETRLYRLSAPKRIIQKKKKKRRGVVGQTYHLNVLVTFQNPGDNLLHARHDEMSISTGRGVGLESVKWELSGTKKTILSVNSKAYTTQKVDGATPMYWFIMAPYLTNKLGKTSGTEKNSWRNTITTGILGVVPPSPCHV